MCVPAYQNIMKYLQSEATEKKQTAFQKGWKITIIKVTLLMWVHHVARFIHAGTFFVALIAVFGFGGYLRSAYRLTTHQATVPLIIF